MERGRHDEAGSFGDRSRGGDLRGASRLVIGAVTGVIDLVEEMHRNVAGPSPIVGAPPTGPARGISGLVYRSIRGVTQAVGFGLDATLALLEPLLQESASSPRRDAVLAALNGVVGDQLAGSSNPLAIRMALRPAGPDQPGGKLLVLVHGLCMSDKGWRREGGDLGDVPEHVHNHDPEQVRVHDHGASLARDLGFSAIYLSYNSGLPIAVNGGAFAERLEELVRDWPVPVQELVIVAHSMGGLVARDACVHASQRGYEWPRQLTKLVCLGTPHHGAPLERAGSRVDFFVRLSPYTAPFARLGQLRSAGIQDLRHGLKERRPLPRGVRDYVIAASLQASPASTGERQRGDGLVPVKSALGQHEEEALTLPVPASRQEVFYGTSHFDLLGPRVYERIRGWLAEPDEFFEPFS